MLAYQILAGFSEIKTELRKQFPLSKKLDDLQLWFSFDDNVFYAHDYQEHEKCIVLATYDNTNTKWHINFGGGYYGKKLVHHAINRFKISDLAHGFYELYKLNGHFTLR